MNRFFRTGVAVALVSLLAPGLVAAQQGLSKRDGRGPVSVTVTLIEAPATGGPAKVKVSLDTHSVPRSDGNWGLLTKRERKERHSMTKDPVRAMSIDEKKAAATAVFQSKTAKYGQA